MTDIEWWDQPCPSCGRARMAVPCSDAFHVQIPDRRAASIIQEVIERIAANGPPKRYAGNWPYDQAQRIVKALSDGGFEIRERAEGQPASEVRQCMVIGMNEVRCPNEAKFTVGVVGGDAQDVCPECLPHARHIYDYLMERDGVTYVVEELVRER